MIKIFKSNKFIIILLLIVCIIFMFNPTIYAKSCLNGLSVWCFKILPLLFPFFIFTKIIVNLFDNKPNFMDKFFNKIYNAPTGSSITFFLATLSGYPMGAKLISTMFDNKQINTTDATKMLSFCSVSGPMFMLGTVGIMMLKSYKAGLIILISNIIASLLNGLIYRGKPNILKQKGIYNKNIKSNNLLADSVYDSIVSILTIGGYIVLSFLIIDMLNNLNILSSISNLVASIFNCKSNSNVINSILSGSIEITRGIADLSITDISLPIKTIISSGLVGFGGISILLQSTNFLSKLNIKTKTIITQKLTQGLLALLVCTPLSLLFL